MKRLLFIIILFAVMGVYAQDVIVKKDGSTIISKIVEIGTTEIKYKRFSNLDGPLFTISKADVLSINYANGEKDMLSTSNESTSKSLVVGSESTNEEHKLEAGTMIPLQNINYIRASKLSVGQPVYFRTGRDIKVDGIDVIPYGTSVKGIVYEAKRSSWFGTKGRLGIRINEIELPGGLTIPLTNGDVYVTGKNRSTLSVLLFLFVVWPACFICGSKAELPAGYEIMSQVAKPVCFTEQGGRLTGKVIDISPIGVDNGIGQKTCYIKMKGTSSKIHAIIQSDDNDYYYYKKASKPNGKILKIKKSRVKEIVEN